jgi:hypothetical protein
MKVVIRRASVEKIVKYHNDSAFKYDNDYRTAPNLWEEMKRWFFDHFFNFIFKRVYHHITLWDILKYGIIVAALVFLVWYFIKASKTAPFSRSEQNPLQFNATTENIHRIDFEKRIADAIQNGEYRLAIRYLYLRTLKELSDRNLIKWKAEKTNRDYSGELRNTKFGIPFSSITSLYDYAWYGNMPVGETAFHTVKESFDRFNQILHPRK